CGLDRNHAEGVHLAIFTADRDIFAVAKDVIGEAIAGLVVVLRRLVIIENPARVLGTARLVDQLTELVVLALPESTHAAMLPLGPPQLPIHPPTPLHPTDAFLPVPL